LALWPVAAVGAVLDTEDASRRRRGVRRFVGAGDVSSVVGWKGSGPAALSRRSAYSGMGQGKFRGIGTGRRHRHLDAADRDADLGAPIFKSFNRIVPQVASARRVRARPRRRSAQIST
jgi:hypothetical protein